MDASAERAGLRHMLQQADLWPLVWAQLGSEERAAMRLTCREARATADALLDTAVMRVPEQVSQDTPSAAAVAAFHRRLPLRRLSVQYGAHGRSLEAVEYCADYTAATGGGLSKATACHISVNTTSDDQELHLPACMALLHALPQLQALHLAWPNGTPAVAPQLLASLGLCQHLRSLVLARDELMLDDDMPLGDDGLRALCGLTQLHTLRCPWRLTRQQLQTLCSALPGLGCLGASGLDEIGAGSAFHSIHTLTGPPIVVGADDDAPASWTWTPWLRPCLLAPNVLPAFPALERLQGISIYVTCDADLGMLPACAAALVERFAACADGWYLIVDIDQDAATAIQQQLAPGCWRHLRNIKLRWCDAEHDTEAASSQLQASLLSLAAAAPNLTDVLRDTWRWSPFGLVGAALPALRRMTQLQALWMVTGGVHVADTTAMLMDLAMGLAGGSSAASGSGGSALRRIMFRSAYEEHDVEEVVAATQAMLALGCCVHVDYF